MKNKIIILVIIFSIITLLIFFINNINKNQKSGNNKSVKEIEQHLLNIDSYKAKLSVTIKSNKNETIYKIEQEVNNEYAKQKIIEPEIIKNTEFLYENNTLTIKNTDLNASKVYNDFPFVSNNILFLTTFLKKYSNASEKSLEEIDNTIIMKIKNDITSNKYNSNQVLNVNKQTLKPISLEISDANNQSKVYILYNEIEL